MKTPLTFLLLASLSAFSQDGVTVRSRNGNATNLTVKGGAANIVAIAARAATGQTTNILEVQNSSGSPLVQVSASGVLSATNIWNQANVLKWGAIADGETDNLLPFQTAIRYMTNASAVNAELVIPRGTYLLGSQLVLPGAANLTIRGEGKRATIILYTGTGSAIVNSTNSGGGGYHIKDLTLKSGGANTGNGFDLTKGERWMLLENLFVDGFTNGTGIKINDTHTVTINNSLVNGCLVGLELGSFGDDNRVISVQINGLTLENMLSTNYSAKLDNCSSIRWFGGTIESNGAGILVTNSPDVTIAATHHEANGAQPYITVDSSYDVSIVGNKLSGPGQGVAGSTGIAWRTSGVSAPFDFRSQYNNINGFETGIAGNGSFAVSEHDYIAAGTNTTDVLVNTTLADELVTSGKSRFTGNMRLNSAGTFSFYNAANTRSGKFYTDGSGSHVESHDGSSDPLYLSAPGASGEIYLAPGSAISPTMRLFPSGGITIGVGAFAVDPGAGKLIVQNNVGIGTTTPAAKLDVAGDIRVGGAAVFSNSVTMLVDQNLKIGNFSITANVDGNGLEFQELNGPSQILVYNHLTDTWTIQEKLLVGEQLTVQGGQDGIGLTVDADTNYIAGVTRFASNILTDVNLLFEGATADGFETTLTATDPTADRTVTFQNASGTVAYLSDISAGGGTNRYYEAGEAFHWVEVGGTNGDPYGIKGASSSATVSTWSIDYGGNVMTDGNITAQGSLNITSGAQLDSTLTVGDTLTVGAGVNANGGGLKHGRVTTGSIAGLASAAVTLTWTTPFANANYTVTASVVEADATVTTLRKHHIESQTASAVVVRVINDHTTDAKTGTLNVIAIHD